MPIEWNIGNPIMTESSLSFQESQAVKEPRLTSTQGKQVPWAVKDPSLAVTE